MFYIKLKDFNKEIFHSQNKEIHKSMGKVMSKNNK